MANVITTLPVELTGNNGTYNYTRERDILEMSVQSPKNNNLLPFEYIIDNYSTSYNNGLTRSGRIFHFDFSKINSTNQATCLLIKIDNRQLKKNTEYTLSFKIHDIYGTKFSNFEVLYRVEDTNLRTIKYVNLQEGLYSLTFVTPEDYHINEIRFGHFNWATQSKDYFDIEVIGISEGKEQPQSINYAIFNKPVISVSNSTNILGEYELSRKINRHIKQLERNITKEQDTFKLTWR